MESITLARTGRAPLAFTGELLAESDGERQAGREQNRWHDLAVYRTESGRYVARVGYRTKWEGELDRADAATLETPAEVAAWFTAHDPAAAVKGFPSGAAYAERQAKLLADVRGRYQAQVSEILSGPVFAVNPDSEEPAVATKPYDRKYTVYPDQRAVEVLGASTQSLNQALECWADAIARASADNAQALAREEWNLLADVCNGTLWEPASGSPGVLLAASVEDAHRLDGTGYKWLADEGVELAGSLERVGAGKPTKATREADARVADLVKRLAALDYAHAWAAILAVQFFWEHPQEIDHAADPWWTTAFRRRMAQKKAGTKKK